jgi:hypothetical protein
VRKTDQLRVISQLVTVDQMRGDTHRRGRMQECGRLRWILSSEMGHVPVLGSSMWMWPMLRIKQVNMIPEEDKNNIPKLVRAMQLNIKCTKDEWLAESIEPHKQTQEEDNGELT